MNYRSLWADVSEADALNLSTHNVVITITSLRTGDHRTLRVRTVRKGGWKGKRLIDLMVKGVYETFGFVDPYGRINIWQRFQTEYHQTLANMVTYPSRWRHKAEYHFDKRCRICNIQLTNPQSLALGIGPECAKKQHIGTISYSCV